MEVTAKTLREVEFREKMRGYHPEDVDHFLEQVASQVEVLQDRLRQAVERAQRAEAAASEAGGTDDTLRKTLVLAQRTADLAVQEAREQAARILASAEQQAQAIIAEAEERGRKTLEDAINDCKAELSRLENMRAQAQQDVDGLVRWVEEHKVHLQASLSEAMAAVERAGLLWPAPSSRAIDLTGSGRPGLAASSLSYVQASGVGSAGLGAGLASGAGSAAGIGSGMPDGGVAGAGGPAAAGLAGLGQLGGVEAPGAPLAPSSGGAPPAPAAPPGPAPMPTGSGGPGPGGPGSAAAPPGAGSVPPPPASPAQPRSQSGPPAQSAQAAQAAQAAPAAQAGGPFDVDVDVDSGAGPSPVDSGAATMAWTPSEEERMALGGPGAGDPRSGGGSGVRFAEDDGDDQAMNDFFEDTNVTYAEDRRFGRLRRRR